MASKRPLVLTPGEPGGVGLDILVQHAQSWCHDIPLIAITDVDLLQQRADQLQLDITIQVHTTTDVFDCLPVASPKIINVWPVHLGESSVGSASQSAAPGLLESLRLASDWCLKGDAAGLVTGPVCKASIHAIDNRFLGHTHWLAEYCGIAADDVVMMLGCDQLKVALVTDHIPLNQVAQVLSATAINKALNIIHADLVSRFGISKPKLALCGLNPHAGENGTLGLEEQTIIFPALAKAKERGILVDGPFPADSLFQSKMREQYDVIVALYHDQGLAPLKAVAFNECVNVTLGLPFIRTSVDHGTAFSLAGTGKACHQSLESAIMLASQLAKQI